MQKYIFNNHLGEQKIKKKTQHAFIRHMLNLQQLIFVYRFSFKKQAAWVDSSDRRIINPSNQDLQACEPFLVNSGFTLTK